MTYPRRHSAAAKNPHSFFMKRRLRLQLLVYGLHGSFAGGLIGVAQVILLATLTSIRVFYRLTSTHKGLDKFTLTRWTSIVQTIVSPPIDL